VITLRRIVRIRLNERTNGAVLRNMCEAMMGENTIELAYSGPMSDVDKALKRSESIGGCDEDTCRRSGSAGSSSCNEFPPAATDEDSQSIFTLSSEECIPAIQNVRQGQRFGTLVRTTQLQKGDLFAYSLDCEAILDLDPPEYEQPVRTENITTADDIFPPEDIITDTTVLIALGDLTSGIYRISFKVEAGSVQESYIVDNLGDQLDAHTQSIGEGDEHTHEITIGARGALMGVGLVLPTTDNGTRISWTVEEAPLPNDATGSSTRRAGATGTAGGGGGDDDGLVSSAVQAGAERAVLVGGAAAAWWMMGAL